MSRLIPPLRRMRTAALLCLCFPAAIVHAQFLNFRIDAPKDIDSETLRQDIGTLQITFSGNNAFLDVKNYEERYLNLSDEFQWSNSSSSSSIRYQSFNLSLVDNADDGNGACWYASGSPNFSVSGIQKSLRIGSDATIYYRVYSPHFNRIFIGEIKPSDERGITIHRNEMATGRRVAFQPVIGREGSAVPAKFAPDLRTGTGDGSGYGRNMYDLTEPFAVYANTGDTLRYLVYPKEDNLALHADSIVVTDTTTCVTTDYRKATLCYFYITDTNGNLCPTDGGLMSVYYPQKAVSDKLEYGYGYGFYNLSGSWLKLTSPDGTKAGYALPGTQVFQFVNPVVDTTDPDFLMPYNAHGRYILKQVTIPASTEPVKISLGESTLKRVVTTLADAAPYADHLSLEAASYVSRPYAWRDNVRMDIGSREVSRQIKGNDLVITTLIEGSTSKPAIKLNAAYSAQSDTIPVCVNAEADLSDKLYQPARSRGEYRITQEQFVLDAEKSRRLDFATIRPVNFVLPCHLMQANYKLTSDFPASFVATHHAGCAKSLPAGSESSFPYDTITVLLNNDKDVEYSWYVQQGDVKPSDDHIYHFNLDAAGSLEQRLPDSQFSMLRVSNLGVDSIYVYNGVPEYKVFKFEKGGSLYSPIYYAKEVLPLHAGYNEHVIKYRQIKIEKDTFNTIRYWIDTPFYYNDEEGNLHPSYTSYTIGSHYGLLDRMRTSTSDSLINISTGSRANLAISHGSNTAPAYLIEIAPSEADTIVSIYKDKNVSTQFVFNGEILPSPGFLWLNMCFNDKWTHVAPAYRFNHVRFRMDLLPGHYTVEGVLGVLNPETGRYEDIPISTEFDIPSSGDVELNPSATGITPPVVAEGNGISQVKARYTIDGRRIDAPQRGVNIVMMNDGTLRKVIVK